MKRLVLSAIALSMLALPTVQAQAAPKHNQPAEQHVVVKKKVVKKHVVKRHETNRHAVHKPVKHWSRGQHVPAWQRKQVVRDYRHYGLKRPGYGQQWVRVDNDYLLISIASGVIAGLLAAN